MIPDDEVLAYYRDAGKIAANVLEKGAVLIREGDRVLDVVESVEQMVEERGAGLAFPLNLSFNEDAAHDTASADEQRIFSAGDVVKLDLGVHLEGYIADTAVTVDLGDNGLLLEASRSALEKAIEIVRPGITSGELGRAIQQEIEARGFRPITNLTGHGLARFSIHTPPSIPNIAFPGGARLEEGMVFAIEPFATYGKGKIKNGKPSIFALNSRCCGNMAGEIRNRFGSLPFTPRWIPGTEINELKGAREYFEMIENDGEIVAQAEHTVIVNEDGCEVITRLAK